ncbi:MAG: sulfatase-like hydrolase/transferase [Planctomycetota bacterium]
MKHLQSCLCLFGYLMACSLTAFSQPENALRPNIIYIFPDDLGVGGVGYIDDALGDRNPIKTPNIDFLAKNGMRFTRAYSATLCSPSRAMLFLGLHNGHTMRDTNVRPAPFYDTDTPVPKVMKRAGYQTALIGKHGFSANGSYNPAKAKVTAPESTPNRIGFDTFFGHLSHKGAWKYTPPNLWEATDDPSVPHGLKLTPTRSKKTGSGFTHDVFTERAIDYIRQNAEGKTPFYLQLNYTVPHKDISQIRKAPAITTPGLEQPRGTSLYANSGLGPRETQYASIITRMDTSIGHLIAALKDPNGDGNPSDSIIENTLILFQSDNGATGVNGIPPVESLKSNGDYRGEKRSLYEGGIHVPAFAYWKGTIASGSTFDGLTDLADFLPTAADLAGVHPPVGLDGVSLVPAMTGKKAVVQRDFVVSESGKGMVWAIVNNEDNMKLIAMGKGKDITSYELYDLNTDPTESSPLPLVEEGYRKMKDRLQAIALAECVEEFKDYAAVNRQWCGTDGGDFSKASNWSKSETPDVNWLATMAAKSSAIVRSDAAVLGLETQGTLSIEDGITLTARNEFRVSGGGHLQLDGGTIRSIRWANIYDQAELRGHGKIDTLLQNESILSPEGGTLTITGNYHQYNKAALVTDLNSPLVIGGEAALDGNLEIRIKPGTVIKKGTSFTVLRAKSLSGKFDVPNDRITADDGTSLFRIEYTSESVSLIRV